MDEEEEKRERSAEQLSVVSWREIRWRA
jgi:hypothetical protein